MKNLFKTSVVIIFYLFLGATVMPEASSGGAFKPDKKRSEEKASLHSKIEPAEVHTVAEAIDIAESYFKQALNTDDIPQQEVLFPRAVDYFDRAHEILNKERAELLLKEGWLKLRWSLSIKDAEKMLEEGLELTPSNPVAYYKVADLKLDKYFFSLPTYTDKPQRTKKMPNGNVIFLEPTYRIYSEENDNTLLEEAQKLAEKAVQLDPTFANAYDLLARIHGFKKEREKTVEYDYLLFKNKAHLNMELFYYNEEAKNSLLRATESRLKHRAPEKFRELEK